MEAWIPITVAAALFQNLRSALQKHLKGRLATSGATYARFCYAVPFTAAYAALLAGPGHMPVPELNASFAVFAVTLGKVFLVDMGEVEAVYRILSFLVLGLMMLAGALLYHRKFIAAGAGNEQPQDGQPTPPAGQS